MTRYDAIIIGAGMSGLAAAIRLAQFDQRVLVLERHEVWGGLNSFYTKEGRAFDVGLHAVTNWAPPRTRGAPLGKVLRQLRLDRDELRLGEQTRSRILLPGLELAFTNDFGVLEAAVAGAFPAERDGFRRLVGDVRAHDLGADEPAWRSGRAALAEYLAEPLLREALLLPLLYYGSSCEGDIEWRQLVVLFRSIYLEGLARPEGGVRRILNALVKRLKATGAELRLRAGVRRVLVEGGAARGVELEDGTVLEARRVFSSAGYVESMRLCGLEQERVAADDRGRLSFLESIAVLDRQPRELGHEDATLFYATTPEVRWRVPAGLVDVTSGVLCAPANFAARKPPKEGQLRVTVLANHDAWCALPAGEYARQKELCRTAAIDALVGCGGFGASGEGLVPDWRAHTVYEDVFTPRTIRHFTGHDAGAVYGSPRKRWSGESGVEALHLIGTDQGYLGIVGALISGITMANRHGLVPRQEAVP